MSKTENKFWGKVKDFILSQAFQNKIVDFLKDKLVKLALKKILGSAVMGGFKAWLIKFVVTEVVEKSDEYIIEPLFQKLGFYLDRQEGKTIYRRLEDAQTDDDWYDSANDV